MLCFALVCVEKWDTVPHLQASKSELEVICSITFKAVCLHIGKWDTIEPWHFKPLQIFKSNVSPFFAAVTNITPSFINSGEQTVHK